MTTAKGGQAPKKPPLTQKDVNRLLAQWGHQGPLDRKTVERLIGENGGTARRLDLSGKDLQGADLRGANLQGAQLIDAKLQGAVLRGAILARVHLAGAEISADTSFHDAHWGDHRLGDELAGDYDLAAAAYRGLRIWHENAGLHHVAREFHYREMSLDTRAMWREARHRFRRATSGAWARFRGDLAATGRPGRGGARDRE